MSSFNFYWTKSNQSTELIYRYIANIILPENYLKNAKAIWKFSIYRFLVNKLKADQLSDVADELISVISDKQTIELNFYDFLGADLIEIADWDVSPPENLGKRKKDFESAYKKSVEKEYWFKNNILSEYFNNIKLDINNTSKFLEKVFNDYKSEKITLGELSIICFEVMEINQKYKGSIFERCQDKVSIVNDASFILPTYFYNEEEAGKLKQSVLKQVGFIR